LFELPSFSQTTSTKKAKDSKSSHAGNYHKRQLGYSTCLWKTDADVFGMLYAQCEDDFLRIEMNYIEKLGRLSEIKGQSVLYNDLETR
jgi:hypothetical protein